MTSLKDELFDLIAPLSLGHQCYLVGGSLRDEFLGLPLHDFDFAVEHPSGAETITRDLHALHPNLFSSPHHMGAQYPIWQITWKGLDLQFADTHRERYPDPNSRQRVLEFASLEEDCKRRDFTINMLYQRVRDREVLDPSRCAVSDIRSRTLRCFPGESAEQVLEEDPLRILRLLRFSCQFHMQVTPEMIQGLQAQKDRLHIVSKERVRDELSKTMLKGCLAPFLRLCQEHSLLPILFPELLPMIGCTQDRFFHSEGDVWEHTLKVIEKAPHTLRLQLAALLHDVGKPSTRSEHGERIKFLGHEKISAQIAESFLRRYHFPKQLTHEVILLVELHLRGSNSLQWKGLKAARKFLRDSAPLTQELLQLIEADSRASHGPDGQPRLDHLVALRKALEECQNIPIATRSILSGVEIMKLLHLEPGPKIGELQKALVDLADDFAERGEVLDPQSARNWLLQNHTKSTGN